MLSLAQGAVRTTNAIHTMRQPQKDKKTDTKKCGELPLVTPIIYPGFESMPVSYQAEMMIKDEM